MNQSVVEQRARLVLMVPFDVEDALMAYDDMIMVPELCEAGDFEAERQMAADLARKHDAQLLGVLSLQTLERLFDVLGSSYQFIVIAVPEVGEGAACQIDDALVYPVDCTKEEIGQVMADIESTRCVVVVGVIAWAVVSGALGILCDFIARQNVQAA